MGASLWDWPLQRRTEADGAEWVNQSVQARESGFVSCVQGRWGTFLSAAVIRVLCTWTRSRPWGTNAGIVRHGPLKAQTSPSNACGSRLKLSEPQSQDDAKVFASIEVEVDSAYVMSRSE